NHTHGNTEGVNNADCSLISDPDNDASNNLDPGETIKVRCWAPANYWNDTWGNKRILFFVHERDLGQDADRSGNAGNTWWEDALAKSVPAGAQSGFPDAEINNVRVLAPNCQLTSFQLKGSISGSNVITS